MVRYNNFLDFIRCITVYVSIFVLRRMNILMKKDFIRNYFSFVGQKKLSYFYLLVKQNRIIIFLESNKESYYNVNIVTYKIVILNVLSKTFLN